MPEPITPPPRYRRLSFLLAGCLLIGVGVQFVDAINDNSIRNAISLIAVGIAYIGSLIWLYRTLAPRWSRIGAALIAVALLIVPACLFRIRGFSGEIIPQVEYRFAKSRQLLTAPAGDAADLASTPEATDAAIPKEFPQFLGPQRNGVLARRDFAIPADGIFPVPLWRIEIGEGWGGFAISGQRCVTLEQRGDQECVTCYRLQDGALLWIHEEPARHENPLGGIGPRSTPTIQGEQVFVQGATGIVKCLDLNSGEMIWRRELLEIAGWDQSQSESQIAWGRAGSPLLVNDLCILPLGGPDDPTQDLQVDGVAIQGRGLIALDAATGAVRWVGGKDQISYASPIRMTLAGVDQIVIVNENSVSGHALDDGQTLWTTRWPGQSNGSANCASAVQVDDHSLLVGKAYGTGSAIYEITQEDGGLTVTDRWKKPGILKTKFTHACVSGGQAFGLSDGTLECVELKDGRRLWAQSRGARYGHGQMLLVEDLLVIQAEAGNLALVSANTERFEELAVAEGLSAKTWNIPSVAGRYLLVRNDAEAICYQLPPREATEVLAADPAGADQPAESEAPASEAPAASEDPTTDSPEPSPSVAD